jgi:two-component system, NarL family, response regulator DegU
MDILLVENNVPFRKMIKKHLGEQFPSLAIEEAGDVGEAFRKIEISPPKLIFMDIQLPGELGLTLTEKIKSRYSKINIAILTNYDFPEYREVSFRSGADYFFAKSAFPWESILELVNKACICSPGR